MRIGENGGKWSWMSREGRHPVHVGRSHVSRHSMQSYRRVISDGRLHADCVHLSDLLVTVQVAQNAYIRIKLVNKAPRKTHPYAFHTFSQKFTHCNTWFAFKWSTIVLPHPVKADRRQLFIIISIFYILFFKRLSPRGDWWCDMMRLTMCPEVYVMSRAAQHRGRTVNVFVTSVCQPIGLLTAVRTRQLCMQ